jgi:histidinol-phosphate aminotransferase
MDICRLFSKHTHRTLAASNEDYVSKNTDEYALIARFKEEYHLDKVYRFDIGRNCDGYSDLIPGIMEQADMDELSRQNLVNYPDNHYNLLRSRLADVHGLDPSWFVLSSGLESMIDHTSRVFLQEGQAFLAPIPNFSVFTAFSQRVGGRPIYLPLKPTDQFQWTEETVENLRELIQIRSPRLLWISNPVNPTGQDLPLNWMEKLAAAGAAQGTIVVVDEAYGEYTDKDDEIISAASFIDKYPNLMVFRTFSKIHALPSLRIGYLMCSSREIVEAVSLYRPMFPFSWFSLFVAQVASIDEEHVQEARRKNRTRREKLCGQLSELSTFSYLPSETNTLMLRCLDLKSDELWQGLAQRGFLTANLGNINGLQAQEFIRLTICLEEENDLLVEACHEIERGLRV